MKEGVGLGMLYGLLYEESNEEVFLNLGFCFIFDMDGNGGFLVSLDEGLA